MQDEYSHPIVHYEIYGESGEDYPPRMLQQLVRLGDESKLVNIYRPCGDAWERLCALEQDMIDASNPYSLEYAGWSINRGESNVISGIDGWMSYDGWILVALPDYYREEKEVDFLIIREADWYEEYEVTLHGWASCGESSGMQLNRCIKEAERLNKLYNLQ